MRQVSLVLVSIVVPGIFLVSAGCQKAQTKDRQPRTVARVGEEPGRVSEKPVSPAGQPRSKPVAERAEPERTVSGPRIRFDKVVYNIGEVGPGSNNLCEFSFENIGGEVLKIVRVKPDCGCIMLKLDKREYAPGEKGVLRFKYHATTLTGIVSRHIVVETNDKVQPKATLSIRGRVVARVDCQPKRLSLRLRGDQPAPEVTLTSLDGQLFSIKNIKSTFNAISADIDPGVEATKFILKLKVDQSRLQRLSGGVIEFSLTHPEATTVSVPFSALTQFKLNPPVIILFDAEPGKPIIRKNVTVLNNYGEPFEIASVRSKQGVIKVLKQEKLTNGYRFTLEITPPDKTDSRKFTDEFFIQIKDGDLLKLNCQGFYRRTRSATR